MNSPKPPRKPRPPGPIFASPTGIMQLTPDGKIVQLSQPLKRPPAKWRPTTTTKRQVQRGNAFLKP
jgi:hypothetical protein